MLNLLMLRFKIIKNRINKIYSKRDILLLTGMFLVLYCAYILGLSKIFLYFKINNTAMRNFNLIIIINLFLLMLISIPINVYKLYFENRKFEILFLSPLKLIKCFSYQLILPIIKLVLVINILMGPFVLICNIKFNFNIPSIILNLSLYTSIIYIFLTFLVFSIFSITKVTDFKKVLLFCTGIIEILYFIVVMTISSKMNLYNLSNKIFKVSYLNIFNYFNKSMLSLEFNVVPIILNLSIVLMIFALTYLLFKNIYYKKGFFNLSTNKIRKQNRNFNFVNKYYFLKKDIKLILRNIERLKFIIIAVIIFMINLLKDRKNVGDLFIQVLLQLIIITLVIQLTFENIFMEKDKKDTLNLSLISTYRFFEQKTIYPILLSSFCISIYNFLIFTVLNIDFSKLLLNIFYSNFFIVILSKLCTSIGVFIFIIQKYSISKILKILFHIIVSISYYLFLIIQIFLVTSLIENILLEILLTSIIMIINNIAINKIIKNILTNKGLLITI